MFLGHYAVALAAKKAAPDVRLGTLVMGAQFLDLLWPAFLLAGIEHAAVESGATRVTPLNFYDYPFSHSLIMSLLWSVAFAAVYVFLRRKNVTSGKAAFVLGVCVFSHWVLDWISHRPDLPLWPGRSPLVGLGLWNHPTVSASVEFVAFAIALVLYWRVARLTVRKAAFWPLVAFLLMVGVSSYIGNVPPDIKPVMWSSFAQWILIVWAYASERASADQSSSGT